jgi:CrcB protein
VLNVILVALGGGLGAALRYGLSLLVQRMSGGDFPWGTIVVNLSGCVLMGAIAWSLSTPVPIPQNHPMRLVLIVGVLGGFTTFSAFAWETAHLASTAGMLQAAGNVVVSVACGIGGIWAGARAAEAMWG